jgi:hypothetical protein
MPLADYFRNRARWRSEKAKECPEDIRNARSARALLLLAEYVRSGERNLAVRALDPYVLEGGVFLGEGGMVLGERTQRAVSGYGLGHAVTVASHQRFLEDLLVFCLADAYELARDAGDGHDPYGTLLPCELEAAEHGVTLPLSYFETRNSHVERELEQIIAGYIAGEDIDE